MFPWYLQYPWRDPSTFGSEVIFDFYFWKTWELKWSFSPLNLHSTTESFTLVDPWRTKRVLGSAPALCWRLKTSLSKAAITPAFVLWQPFTHVYHSQVLLQSMIFKGCFGPYRVSSSWICNKIIIGSSCFIAETFRIFSPSNCCFMKSRFKFVFCLSCSIAWSGRKLNVLSPNLTSEKACKNTPQWFPSISHCHTLYK